MDSNLAALKRLIANEYGESDLSPLTEHELAALRNTYPEIPQHLTDFYSEIGIGRVGSSQYMIHDLLPPSDI